jgi:hypothetical protein
MHFLSGMAMRILLIIIAIGLTSSTSALGAQPPDAKNILALENAFKQALLRHDGDALSHLLPETFVYTDYDGTVMNKSQFLSNLKDPANQTSTDSNNNIKVFTYNGAAVVVGTYHKKGKYNGKPFEHWGRFTTTWIFQNNLWQCVASHTTLIQK